MYIKKCPLCGKKGNLKKIKFRVWTGKYCYSKFAYQTAVCKDCKRKLMRGSHHHLKAKTW